LGEYNFEKAAEELRSKFGTADISDKDVLSHALYPKVFEDWKEYELVYGDVAHQLPTNLFLNPMKEGEEVEVEVGPGKSSLIRLVTTESDFAREEGTRLVTFEVNGERWFIPVTDQNAALDSGGGREKSTGADGEVGSPMPGVVVGLKVRSGTRSRRARPWRRCRP